MAAVIVAAAVAVAAVAAMAAAVSAAANAAATVTDIVPMAAVTALRRERQHRVLLPRQVTHLRLGAQRSMPIVQPSIRPAQNVHVRPSVAAKTTSLATLLFWAVQIGKQRTGQLQTSHAVQSRAIARVVRPGRPKAVSVPRVRLIVAMAARRSKISL